jgi:anti-anti-sigma regulatory factor
MDPQRLGWYDMAERYKRPGEEFHRLIWHDRKAWWQQEQAILAYLILAGSLKKPEYLKLARESSAFYNAWFPDNDSGGVYFNVLASGIPYLLGNERLKGSHSMSGYHSFELCYLAAIYSNLLITKQPMDLYFKPQAGALKGNVLRVAPDLLPPGSIRLEAVWINGERYADFNADDLTINLPFTETQSHPLEARPTWMGNPRLLPKTSQQELRVKVRIVPAGVHADMELTVTHGSAVLVFEGTLHHDDLVSFQMHLKDMVAAHPRRAVFNMQDLKGISSECTRALAFMRARMGPDTEVYVVAPNEEVKQALYDVGVLEEVILLEDPDQIREEQPVM